MAKKKKKTAEGKKYCKARAVTHLDGGEDETRVEAVRLAGAEVGHPELLADVLLHLLLHRGSDSPATGFACNDSKKKSAKVSASDLYLYNHCYWACLHKMQTKEKKGTQTSVKK